MLTTVKEYGNFYIDTANDSLLDLPRAYNPREGVFENSAMTNNASAASFKIDEHQRSITRQMGRKYSVMSLVPSKSNTKVDIVVTRGQEQPAAHTEVNIPPQERLLDTYDKDPKPPWFAKLCLGFVFIFVIVMMVTAIIVFSTSHYTNNDTMPTTCIDHVVSLNVSDSPRSPVLMNNTFTQTPVTSAETPVS